MKPINGSMMYDYISTVFIVVPNTTNSTTEDSDFNETGVVCPEGSYGVFY